MDRYSPLTKPCLVSVMISATLKYVKKYGTLTIFVRFFIIDFSHISSDQRKNISTEHQNYETIAYVQGANLSH